MYGKMGAVLAQASLALVAWWFTRSDDERREIQASAWKELEKLAMNLAKRSSNLAAIAEHHYKETVSTG